MAVSRSPCDINFHLQGEIRASGRVFQQLAALLFSTARAHVTPTANSLQTSPSPSLAIHGIYRAVLLSSTQRSLLRPTDSVPSSSTMASSGIDYLPNGPGDKKIRGVTVDEEKTYEHRRSDSVGSVRLVHDNTHRKLKSRHIQLIGIGGTIGTALYVQIGRGLMNGGPASLFIAFSLCKSHADAPRQTPQLTTTSRVHRDSCCHS